MKRESPRLLLWASAFFVVFSACGGCAGLRTHDRAKAKLAGEAVEASGKLTVEAVFKAQADAQEAIIAKHIELAREFALADRDATFTIIAIDEKPLRKSWYEPYVEKRVGEVGGKALPAYKRARDSLETAKKNLDFARRPLRGFDVDTSCPGPAPPSRLTPAQLAEAVDKIQAGMSPEDAAADRPETIELLRKLYNDDFIGECRKFLNAKKALESVQGKAVDEVGARINDLQGQISAAQSYAGKIKAGFAELDGAVGKDASRLPSRVIREQLETLDRFANIGRGFARLLGKEKVLAERLKRVDEALGILGGTPPGDADPGDARRKAAVAFAGMPAILDRIAALGEAGENLPRTDLVMVRNELAARKFGVRAAIRRFHTELALLKAQRAAIDGELESYRIVEQRLSYARDAFKVAAAGTDNEGKDILDLSYRDLDGLTAASGKAAPLARAKMFMKDAIARQAQTRMASDIAVTESKLRQAAAIHEAGLAQARANTAQWMAIILPLVVQQRQFHDGGIKPETFAALLFETGRTAGLISIAVGGN